MAPQRKAKWLRALSPLAIMVALFAAPFLFFAIVIRRAKTGDPYEPSRDIKMRRSGLGPETKAMAVVSVVGTGFIIAFPALAVPLFLALAVLIISIFVLTNLRSPEH